MSADDAQQNIPMGHVAKMRQAVDTLNKQKRATKTIGVEIMSVSIHILFILEVSLRILTAVRPTTGLEGLNS